MCTGTESALMAGDLWNKRHCPSPVTVTCMNEGSNIMPAELAKLSENLCAIVQELRDQTQLQTETYLLSRLIYKHNNQLRRDKAFQGLCKIKRCLKNLEGMDLVKVFVDIVDLMPSKETLAVMKIWYGRLPSRQMFEYALVRLMGMCKLLLQTCTYIYTTQVLVLEEITAGLLIHNYLVYAGLISRLWMLCQSLMKSGISWYSSLFPWQQKLQGAQVEWMPPSFSLPEDFTAWLASDVQETLKKELFTAPEEGASIDEVETSLPGLSDFTLTLDEDIGELIPVVPTPARSKITSAEVSRANTTLTSKDQSLDKNVKSKDQSIDKRVKSKDQSLNKQGVKSKEKKQSKKRKITNENTDKQKGGMVRKYDNTLESDSDSTTNAEQTVVKKQKIGSKNKNKKVQSKQKNVSLSLDTVGLLGQTTAEGDDDKSLDTSKSLRTMKKLVKKCTGVKELQTALKTASKSELLQLTPEKRDQMKTIRKILDMRIQSRNSHDTDKDFSRLKKLSMKLFSA